MPVIALFANDKIPRFVRLEIEGGILPFKLLPSNDNNSSRVNWEMDNGILPVSPLLSKDSPTSCVNSPISLGIVVPFTLSPALIKVLKIIVFRHSSKEGRPINSQAISSDVMDEVGIAVGLSVTGGDVGVVAEGGNVGGDVSPLGRGSATNTTSNTIPTATRRANKQPPTKMAR